MSYIDTYFYRFLVKGSTPFYRDGDRWLKHEHSKFSKELIDLHLQEKTLLGQKLPTDYTNIFVLDFDIDEKTERKNFLSFVKEVSNLIQAPRIIFQSSNSGGIHVYFFIKNSRCEYVKNRVLGLLKAHGLFHISGKLEVFCCNNNLRLPLGKGSVLLDEEFNPVNLTKEESIEKIDSYLSDCSIPHIYTATPSYKRSFVSLSKKQFDNSILVEDLLNEGLQPSEMGRGKFNDSCRALVRYFFRETDGDKEITLRLMISWIDDKHNHNSKTYNDDPRKAYKHIERMVENWSSKAALSITKAIDVDLPYSLCSLIVTYFEGYKKQKSIFNLLCYIYDNAGRRGGFYLPRKLATKGYGINNNNYQEILLLLIDENYLRVVSKGNNYKGYSSIYEWIGPDLKEETTYKHLSLFIEDVKLRYYYSKYFRKEIQEDLKEERRAV